MAWLDSSAWWLWVCISNSVCAWHSLGLGNVTNRLSDDACSNDFGFSQQLCHAIRADKEPTQEVLATSLTHDVCARTVQLSWKSVADDAISDHPNALHKHLAKRAGVQSRAKRTTPAASALPEWFGRQFGDFICWLCGDLEEAVWDCKKMASHVRMMSFISDVYDARYGTVLLMSRQTGRITTDIDWIGAGFSVRPRQGRPSFDDMVPGEVLHHAAKDLAVHLYPLMLKQWLFHQEPLLFKGGLLVSAFKKGNATLIPTITVLCLSPPPSPKHFIDFSVGIWWSSLLHDGLTYATRWSSRYWCDPGVPCIAWFSSSPPPCWRNRPLLYSWTSATLFTDCFVNSC